jgi:hypothetical protein
MRSAALSLLPSWISLVKNFKKGFNGDYGVKLTLNKLKVICEVDWPSLGVEWSPEGSLDRTVVNEEVYRVIVGMAGHLNQFAYIDYWQDAILSWPTWLRPCLEEACRIMVARVATTSKCREKTKEPILAEKPEEAPLLYVPLYSSLPPAHSSAPPTLTLDGEAQGIVTPVKSGSEASGALILLTFLSPMDPIPTPSQPVLLPHPPLDQEHLTSLCEDSSSPQSPAALKMPLREAQSPMYCD